MLNSKIISKDVVKSRFLSGKQTKIIFGIFIAAIASIGWNTYHLSDALSPCDAPLVGDHTGAPGETNCTGCHAGTNNSGPGTVIFDVGGGITQYVPGQTYLCTVSIAQTSINKMGYACVALRNSNNTTIGTFSLTMPATTRLFTSGGRNYVSHNPCGADAPATGSNLWTFNWQAPSTDVGTITLYVAALATNHNHSTTGDYAYTETITLTHSATSVNELQGAISDLNIYPNPAIEALNINLNSSLNETCMVGLTDVMGKIIYTKPFKLQTGNNNFSIPVKSMNIESGIYFLSVKLNGYTATKKVVIQ